MPTMLPSPGGLSSRSIKLDPLPDLPERFREPRRWGLSCARHDGIESVDVVHDVRDDLVLPIDLHGLDSKSL